MESPGDPASNSDESARDSASKRPEGETPGVARTVTLETIRRPSLGERLAFGVFVLLFALISMGLVYSMAQVVDYGEAPRTALERELGTSAAVLDESPEDEEGHAEYARALVTAKQYATAEAVIDRGLNAVPDSPLITLEKARLAWARDDGEEALLVIADVYELVEARRTEFSGDLQERGIKGTFSLPSADALVGAALLEAAILMERGDAGGAVAAYSLALEEDPSMADVLSSRGGAYVLLGMAEEARADFESALTYSPEYGPALQGLAGLEGE